MGECLNLSGCCHWLVPCDLIFLLSHLLLGNETYHKTYAHESIALSLLLQINFLVINDVMHDSMATDEAFSEFTIVVLIGAKKARKAKSYIE